ncbi:plant expansin [Schizopora paradoxa]|uniref:Plant expansin n=1 Tax=Schizopora paradoxa TaxID=27342 RepID=A0A0H2RXU0_9AGAM|nr:plant expansin [Schizopora paradoxa]
MIALAFLSFAALVGLALGSPIANATSLVARQVYTGDATYYAPGLGACGETDGPNDFIAAASYILFDSYPGAGPNPNLNPICGRSITANANGNTVSVRITDRCAGCQGEGDLDFSPAAFQQLAPLSVGRIHGMTWSFN